MSRLCTHFLEDILMWSSAAFVLFLVLVNLGSIWKNAISGAIGKSYDYPGYGSVWR